MSHRREEWTVDTLTAAEILDSRGMPTVETTLTLVGPAKRLVVGRASVPSGKSMGRHEALERRDGDAHRYAGAGVLEAVRAVEQNIAPAVCGHPLTGQEQLDSQLRELDGTPNKSGLGANAILSVSLAAARARAQAEGEELFVSLGGANANLLPVPCFNVVNGGAHADNPLAFQEFMIAPVGAPTFRDALRAGAETYHALAKILAARRFSTAVGDEGGFAPAVHHPEEAMQLILEAIVRAGYAPGNDIALALDPAANGFWREGQYMFGDKAYDAAALVNLYSQWLATYPILSIEDGLAEADLVGWQLLTRAQGHHLQVVGDDIFVSEATRVAKGATQGVANAVLLKPNQVGTLSEIMQTHRVARACGFRMMMSHRSGETTDDFIADLAVALCVGQIKAGAPARGERVAKYNRLAHIEKLLGPRARYAGRAAFTAEGVTT